MLAFAAAALVLTAAPAAPTAEPAARPKLAVFDLRPIQGVQPGTATILTSILVADASKAGFDVFSQADISTLLGVEKQKQVLGCTEDSTCLAEIGGALGADLVLSGQVGQIGSRYHLALQLLDAKKAKVVARSAQFSAQNEDALAMTAQSSLAELIATARIPLVPRATATATARTASPPPPPPLARRTIASGPAWRPSRPLAWTTLGLGVAALAGGGVSFSMAQSRTNELKDAWQRADYATFYDQKKSEVNKLTTYGYVGVGAGVALSALGGWFLYMGREPSLTLAPDVAPGRAGLVAVGTF